MSERLTADAPVTVVISAIQALRRFGDTRVVVEDILRLDSEDSVPGKPSRMAAPLCSPAISGMSDTSCTAADSNGRVSVAAACRSTGHWVRR